MKETILKYAGALVVVAYHGTMLMAAVLLGKEACSNCRKELWSILG